MHLLKMTLGGQAVWVRAVGEAGGREDREKSLTPAIVLLPRWEHNSCWEGAVSLAQLRVNSCKLKAATVCPCQYILKEFLIHKLLTLLSTIACLL